MKGCQELSEGVERRTIQCKYKLGRGGGEKIGMMGGGASGGYKMMRYAVVTYTPAISPVVERG